MAMAGTISRNEPAGYDTADTWPPVAVYVQYRSAPCSNPAAGAIDTV